MSSSYIFADRSELDTAVNLWLSDQEEATETYGDINTWDVSGIADFSNLFQNKSTFNSDISNWDVSSGTDFNSMFLNAEAFNQDISSWNVSNGTDFNSMFLNAEAFNQDISSWNVSNGTDFNSMFLNAEAFNQDISSWNVSNGTDFMWMFYGADTFKQIISNWDVSNGDNSLDITTKNKISFANNGSATFSINGTAAVGQTLSLNEESADADGYDKYDINSKHTKLIGFNSSGWGFVAIHNDGSIIMGGSNFPHNPYDDEFKSQLATGVKEIYQSGDGLLNTSFAALKDDGSVITWGLGGNYSDGDSSSVSSHLSSGVKQIYTTDRAFAALKDDGSVVTWGERSQGGNGRKADGYNQDVSGLDSGVKEIYSNGNTFAALKDDGSVITWGASANGRWDYRSKSNLTSGVKEIFFTPSSFAALKDDGSVITWGSIYTGGNGRRGDPHITEVGGLDSGVIKIFPSQGGNAYAALKHDGSVITWGRDRFISGYDSWIRRYGSDSSPVSDSISSGVIDIFSAGDSFAALKDNGSVVSWGNLAVGYYGPNFSGLTVTNSGVSKIVTSTDGGTVGIYAALKNDGSVITWGGTRHTYFPYHAVVKTEISSGVKDLFSTDRAFAALKDDGSVHTWTAGGNSETSDLISSGVKEIFTDSKSFFALKDDGSIVTWGGPIWYC